MINNIVPLLQTHNLNLDKNSIFAAMKKGFILNLILLFFAIAGKSQNATVVGKVTDEQGQGIPYVVVYDQKTPQSPCQTDIDGLYRLSVTPQEACVLIFSVTGYKKTSLTISIADGEVKTLNKKLEVNTREVSEVMVVSKRDNDASLTKINPKYIQSIPSVGMSSVESSIKTQPGVTSRNEFSSQYNVRGGNFDENLTYVNDIMIYRPILIRSGQQEGLSFINPDMVGSISFSSGGFDAEYGDKMSSVLDIKYRKPTAFAASTNLSLIGVTGHVENVSKDGRFTMITGVRYKNNRMIISKMDEKGDYRPTFADVQTQMTYQISKKSQLGFLGYFSHNNYLFVPKDKETIFGSQMKQYSMYVAFQGNEENITNSLLGAIWNQWTFNENTNVKLTVSAYSTDESEAYDIISSYRLNEVQATEKGKLDTVGNLAIGSFFKHARNDLNANVISTSLILNHDFNISTFSAGIDCQYHRINEDLNSWIYIDSADYNVPYSDTSITIGGTIYNKIRFNNYETGAFAQNNWKLQLGDDLLSIIAGVRSSFKTSNQQLVASPRIRLMYKPAWKRNMLFRLAFGYYYQTPFFKEMVGADGTFYPQTKDQESIHYVAGCDYYLKIWERPFKLTVESYYKDLKRIIPYTIDNVSLQYFPDKSAKGYATGLDMKLNGEFIKGTESWVSLSVMQTKEKIDGTGNTWQRRPTDQLINLGIFVQDYLPWNNSYKMSMTMYYASKVLSNPADLNSTKQSGATLPAYSRVDVGFSKQIIAESNTAVKPKYSLKSLWVGIEILNLLDFSNTVSYFWIKDVNGYNYPTPNKLTNRMFNIKLSAKI